MIDMIDMIVYTGVGPIRDDFSLKRKVHLMKDF